MSYGKAQGGSRRAGVGGGWRRPVRHDGAQMAASEARRHPDGGRWRRRRGDATAEDGAE